MHKKRTGNSSFLALISVQKVSAYFNYFIIHPPA
nr:MAG TPA: hypothetical protein [Caudoviricetes sp.]